MISALALQRLQKVIKNRKITSPLITLVVLIAFLSYYTKNRESFSVLGNLSIVSCILVGLIELLIILTTGLYTTIAIKMYGKHDSLLNITITTFKSSVINFFGFFQGGIGYRAFYLKKNHDISYKNFTVILAMNYIALFFVSCIFGLAGLLLQPDRTVIQSLPVLFLLLPMLVMTSILLVAPSVARSIPILNKNNRILSVLKTTENYRKYWKHFLQIAALQYTLSAVITYVLLGAIGVTVSVTGLLIYAAVAQFSILIALTPSAIGIKEGLLIATQDAIGVSTNSIVLVATIERLVYFFLLAVLGIALLAVAKQEKIKSFFQQIR